MPHSLPELPYAQDALAPHISAETLSFHYGKHHAGYVKKLNAALEGHALADVSPEEVVDRISEVPEGVRGKAFNCAAQHINHSFYWNCMGPNGGGVPSGALADAIDNAFGSFDEFKAAFTARAAGHFGSGWAWLVKDADGKLSIVDTHDADTPRAHGYTPLLTCDVWEHAYYIDYRNGRGTYIAAFWSLVNWDFVASQL
jgi:Fe-Mn family superoxide dismutase